MKIIKIYKNITFIIIIIISAFLINYLNPKTNQPIIIKTLQNIKGKKIEISVIAGKYWYNTHFGTHSKLSPQMAIWLEDNKGNLIQTLYVSRKFAKQKWNGDNFNKNKTFRISSMPYWLNKLNKSNHLYPTRNNPLPDTITGATPTDSFVLNTKIKEGAKKYRILAEFNNSFDYNNFYTKEKTSYKGQPSIIWSGEIDLKKKLIIIKPKVIGHGSLDGLDGKLYNNIDKLTTSLQIINEIRIKFK